MGIRKRILLALPIFMVVQHAQAAPLNKTVVPKATIVKVTTVVGHDQPVQTPVPQVQVVKTEPTPPKECASNQWLRADNGECIDKPAQPEPVKVQTAAKPVSLPTNSTHEQLMTAAGISPSDFGAVEYIVTRESGWRENATNAESGAHGLPQALPYSKTGCGWVDAVCQLAWADKYAKSRFGGWWSAQAYWASHGNW